MQKIRSFSALNIYKKGKTNVFISLNPATKGGGSNTFSSNLVKWIKYRKDEFNLVYNICKADRAIVIADKIDIKLLETAKKNGCFIIHRLDEHVESDENEYRKQKHQKIRDLNDLADVTVYQSNFVFENMHPFLDSPEKYKIIYNGANQNEFYPTEKIGKYIGHVTWGIGEKKRLDVLYDVIKKHPEESFLLIGNHIKSSFNFTKFPNVKSVGPLKRTEILPYLHKMKFLFFPSENDPCPNTVVESILAGVPVCYNPLGGTKELVKGCGLPISDFSKMLANYEEFRNICLSRNDLHFDSVAQKYMDLT
ncbi:MAG: glycosyltransferase [Deltaproteobacteria bacterium]|nr:glycosyltransferase [Deltaproteobacteria bacterium]